MIVLVFDMSDLGSCDDPNCLSCGQPNVVAETAGELVLDEPKSLPPTVPAPPPAELNVGDRVRSVVEPSQLGTVVGLTDRWFAVVWDDGFRLKHYREELEAL